MHTLEIFVNNLLICFIVSPTAHIRINVFSKFTDIRMGVISALASDLICIRRINLSKWKKSSKNTFFFSLWYIGNFRIIKNVMLRVAINSTISASH